MKSIMQIKQALAQEVESYMIPAKIFFVDAVPKNVNLKIDRMAAKRIIENLTEQRG